MDCDWVGLIGLRLGLRLRLIVDTVWIRCSGLGVGMGQR